MLLSSIVILLFSLVISTAASALPPAAALIIALESSNTSTILFASTPTTPAILDTQNNSNNDVDAAAATRRPSRTITQTARVTQTSRPNEPEPIIIFPFHLVLTEHCLPSSSADSPCDLLPQPYTANNNTTTADLNPVPGTATAIFRNGDWITGIAYLGIPNRYATVEHHIPGYPRTLRVGPYDAGKGELRFSYTNGEEWACEWTDAEKRRVCGECRGRGWNRECSGKGEGGGVRTKEMDCSFIMGWKHQLRASVVEAGMEMQG